MKQTIIDRYITQVSHQIEQLNAMIATFEQAQIMTGLTRKERQAVELLKDARLKLIEASDEAAQEEGA
jgi:hypothetical protein